LCVEASGEAAPAASEGGAATSHGAGEGTETGAEPAGARRTAANQRITGTRRPQCLAATAK